MTKDVTKSKNDKLSKEFATLSSMADNLDSVIFGSERLKQENSAKVNLDNFNEILDEIDYETKMQDSKNVIKTSSTVEHSLSVIVFIFLVFVADARIMRCVVLCVYDCGVTGVSACSITLVTDFARIVDILASLSIILCIVDK